MKRFISAGLVVLALAGCATPASTVPWYTLRESNFRDLRAGVTTKEEARKSLGAPFAVTSFARLQEETWDYRYVDLSTIMHAVVYFDAKGVYTHYWSERDPAHYSGFGS